jgi:hypothetical protein
VSGERRRNWHIGQPYAQGIGNALAINWVGFQAVPDVPNSNFPRGHPWQKKKLLDSRQLSTQKVLLPHARHCFHQ